MQVALTKTCGKSIWLAEKTTIVSSQRVHWLLVYPDTHLPPLVTNSFSSDIWNCFIWVNSLLICTSLNQAWYWHCLLLKLKLAFGLFWCLQCQVSPISVQTLVILKWSHCVLHVLSAATHLHLDVFSIWNFSLTPPSVSQIDLSSY